MTIKTGDTAIFKGYTELADGEEPILIAGEEVQVGEYDDEDGTFILTAVDDESRSDTAFEEELDEVEAPAPKKRTRASAKKAAPKRAAPKKKAAAPVEEEEPEEEPEEEAPAPKKKAAPKKGAPKKHAAAKEAPKKLAAAKEAPKKAPAPVASKFVVMDIIADLVTDVDVALEAAKEMAGELAELEEQHEETVFSLGGVLSYVKREEGFKDAGYDSIEAYTEGELGVKSRKTQAYISIYENLTAAGVTMKQIEGIGWTKLREIATTIDKSNKTALLKAAKTKSRDELQDHIKAIKTGKASPTSDAAARAKFPAFTLFEDQGDALNSAVKVAQSTFEVDNMGEALYLISQDWMAAQDQDVPVEDALEAFNARYGTDFEVEDQ